MAESPRVIQDMLNSMLRSDYIALSDSEKLRKLSQYYVDYMGCLGQILSDSDQLVVGRRGTGKTTLLYRALIECMNSWSTSGSLASPKTLGIYLDVSKCQSLNESGEAEFVTFETSFVSDLCNAIVEEINRSWPEAGKNHILQRIFNSTAERKRKEVERLASELSRVLQSGIPTLIQRTEPTRLKAVSKTKDDSSVKGKALVKASPVTSSLQASAEIGTDHNKENQFEAEWSEKIHYRLNTIDVLNAIGALRKSAEISSIYIFIDEFSALSDSLQRRLTTLVKKF